MSLLGLLLIYLCAPEPAITETATPSKPAFEVLSNYMTVISEHDTLDFQIRQLGQMLNELGKNADLSPIRKKLSSIQNDVSTFNRHVPDIQDLMSEVHQNRDAIQALGFDPCELIQNLSGCLNRVTCRGFGSTNRGK